MARRAKLDRRQFVQGACAGLTAATSPFALARVLAAGGNLDAAVHPLAPRDPHFAPKAKRLLMIFLTGGFSHVDTFDPKPRLRIDHDKPLGPGFAAGSPFVFRSCGQSGLPISELFPHLQRQADELCVLRTLHTDIVEHFQATLAMHTGSSTVPMPSLGAWLSYGLGTSNPNLPSYVVLAEHLPYAGAQVWDNNFLPPYHQGVRILPGDEPIADVRSPAANATLADLEHRVLQDLNAWQADARPGDLNLAARTKSFDTARGMMQAAPEALAIHRETAATREAYGVADDDNRSFAWQCLAARRLLERGVRVVELIDTGSHDNWDAHGDMQQHRGKAARVDQPIAALLADCKQRGLLDETLIAVCTEFGRTPWTSKPGFKGREHHAQAFTCLLAGAGIRGGMSHGETDDHGIAIAANPVHVHDYHATILHLLGFDHERLAYRYAGRDFRLTDVAGNVLRDVLS